MAQTGFTPIKIYSSSTAAAVPLAANLAAGELAINTADGKLFYKDSSGVVQTIGTKGGVGSSTTTQVLYNNAGALAGSANLTFDGSQLTISGIEVGPGAGNITSNAAIGNDALLVNTTGNNNVAVGGNTLKANTTGIRNAGLGYASLLTNVSGSYNTGAGALSLAVATGSYNTTIGFNSGGSISTGGKNSILGFYSGFGAPISQTGSNYVVLSDGDGNVRAHWNGANPTFPGVITLSDGTANSIAYLNSSKVLTTDTALGFDDGNLSIRATTTLRGFLYFQNTADGGTIGYVGNSKAAFTVGLNSALGVRGETGILFGIGLSEKMRLDSTGNLLLGTTGAGTAAAKVLAMANATAPTSSPAGIGQLYVEGGALKFRGSSGTITTIAPA